MGSIRLKTRAAALLVAAIALAVAAATALAGVTVYKNTFTHKGDATELRHAEGKHCNRKFRKKAKNLQINVTKSPDACGYRPPGGG